ncbi:MAG: VCBS repeat-containing protein [Bermanella sp.]
MELRFLTWNENFMPLIIKAFFIFFIAGITSCTNSQNPLLFSDNQASGRISSTFGVHSSGASVYSIPIEIPPGIKGFSPHISLNYSSHGAPGKSGVGWSVSGPTAISRCAAIVAIDGFRGAINYDKNDRFCINGSRLIKVGNTDGSSAPEYMAPGSIYRTELDTWQRVTASMKACGNGPCSFTVDSPDGSILEYGVSEDSRIVQTNGNSVRVWAVSNIVDNNNNNLSYTYTNSPINGVSFQGDGQYYLQEIKYGKNTSAEIKNNRSVEFKYEIRPDISTTYVGGGRVITQARLKTISSKVHNDSRSYTFEYGAPSNATSKSLLRKVTECGNTAAGINCKVSTNFNWQENSVSVETNNISASLTSKYEAIFPGDLNGDGRGDVIQISRIGSTVTASPFISNGNDLKACGTKTILVASDQANFLPMDINGDGRLDIVVTDIKNNNLILTPWITGNQNCAMSQGPITQGPASGKPSFEWPMDIDGNGNTDLLVAWENESEKNVQLISFQSDGQKLVRKQVSLLQISPGETEYWPLDVNADGMVDLALGKKNNNSITLTSAINTDGSFSISQDTSITIENSATLQFWPLDANGDGNVDLVHGKTSGGRLVLTPYLSTGIGSFKADSSLTTGVNTSLQLGFWSMDITGDGSTDLVLAEENNGSIALRVFLTIGGRFNEAQSLGSNLVSHNYQSVWPVDINGDGRVDLIQGLTSGTAMSMKSWIAQGSKPDLLQSAVDGWGRKIAFNYLPMSNNQVYTATGSQVSSATAALGVGYRNTPAAGPFQPVSGGVLHLVSESIESVDKNINPLSYEYTMQWQYADALIDRSGRGWLGFKRVSSLVIEDGLKTTNTYNQAFPLTGTIANTETQCVATSNIETPDPRCPPHSIGTTLTKSQTSYSVEQTATGLSLGTPKVIQTLMAQSFMDTYNYGVYEFTRGKVYEHDQYANVTVLTKTGKFIRSGSHVGATNTSYFCASYVDNPNVKWQFGMVATSKVATDKDSCKNFSADSYNQKSDLRLQKLAYTTDGRQNISIRSSWDDTNKTWLSTHYEYDLFGNAVSVKGPGVPATKITIDDTFHTFKSRIDYPEGLSETYSFDPLSGTLVGMRHQNGAVSISCLNGLGHLQTIQTTPPDNSLIESTNCISSTATGDSQELAKAVVVTTQNISTTSSPTDGVQHISRQLQSWTSVDDVMQTKAIIDGRGRTQIVVSQGQEYEAHFTCSTFDEDDRNIGSSVPAYNPQALPNCSGVPKNQWKITQYDTYQRVKSNSSPDASGEESKTEFSWLSNLHMKSSEAIGSAEPYITEVTFDLFDSKRKPVSMTVSGTNMTSSFQWDALGRLKATIDPITDTSPHGVKTKITYDSLGRRVSVENPDQTNIKTENNSAWSATYDKATGNRLTISDASGQVQHFRYDDLGRMTSRTLSDGSETSWQYDGPEYGKGRVWVVKGKDSDKSILYQITYSYDAAGNVTSKTLEYPSDKLSYTMHFAYDPLKRLRKIIWPDGSSVNRNYTDDNLASINFEGSSVANWKDHTALGSPQKASFQNGTNSVWTYSATGQVLSEKITDSTDNLLIDDVLKWDSFWNLKSINDKLKSDSTDRSQQFFYANKRLKKATSEGLYGELDYDYDDAGNIIKQGDTTFNYRAHQIQTGTNKNIVNYSAQYDGNGNISNREIGKSNWIFNYDPLNRLTRVEESGITTMQIPIYGPRGERLKKIGAGGKQTWYVSPYLRVEEQAGNWKYTRLIRSDDAIVASVNLPGNGLKLGTNASWLYFHHNHINSTTLTTNASGTLATRMVYVPWGTPSVEGASGPDNFVEKFQGKELDSVSSDGQNGIYYFNARYYDPSVGRFLSPDNQLGSHLLRQDAQNRYAFALNNPVTVIDPTGHFSFSALLGGILDVGLVIAGLAVDVLSDGALEPVGGALTGAGINGLQYSVTHGNHFSWSQYAIQNGTGAAIGVATAGLGSAASAGESTVENAAISGVEESAASSSANLAEDSGEDALSSASESVSTDEEGSASASQFEEDDISDCEGNSFPAGTIVWTQEGGQPIEKLQPGDHVIGLNQLQPIVESKSVGKIFSSDVERLTTVELKNSVTSEKIQATPSHPFWTKNIGWVAAEELVSGNQVFSGTGNWLEVISVKTIHQLSAVHNFSVEEAHTYFVGELLAWVHNPKGMGLCDIGGRHYQNTKQVEQRLVESNHFPASSSYEGTPYDAAPRGWRPAVNMDYVDHLETESWGSSHSASAWRATQTKLMKAGKFAEAMAMDIKDMKAITLASTNDAHYLASGMEQAVNFAAEYNPHLNGAFISKAEQKALIALIWK